MGSLSALTQDKETFILARVARAGSPQVRGQSVVNLSYRHGHIIGSWASSDQLPPRSAFLMGGMCQVLQSYRIKENKSLKKPVLVTEQPS